MRSTIPNRPVTVGSDRGLDLPVTPGSRRRCCSRRPGAPPPRWRRPAPITLLERGGHRHPGLTRTCNRARASASSSRARSASSRARSASSRAFSASAWAFLASSRARRSASSMRCSSDAAGWVIPSPPECLFEAGSGRSSPLGDSLWGANLWWDEARKFGSAPSDRHRDTEHRGSRSNSASGNRPSINA